MTESVFEKVCSDVWSQFLSDKGFHHLVGAVENKVGALAEESADFKSDDAISSALAWFDRVAHARWEQTKFCVRPSVVADYLAEAYATGVGVVE